MKNICLTLIITILLCTVLHAQSTFEDSRALYEKKYWQYSMVLKKVEITVNASNAAEVLNILFKYLPDAEQRSIEAESDPVKKFEIYRHALQENKFISISGVVQDNPITRADLTSNLKATAATLSGGAGLVTNITDGLAKFMVARMKQELTIMFFDRLNKFLEEQPDIKVLFPKTYSIMLMAKHDIYNYQYFLPALRESFTQDLSGFLQNIEVWLNSSLSDQSVLHALKQEPVLYACIMLGVDLAVAIERGDHPGDVLHQLTDKVYLDTINDNLKPTLQTVDLISQSLRAGDGTSYWIAANQFKLFQDVTFTQLYFGLLYQQALIHPVRFTNTTLEQLLAKAAPGTTQLTALKNYVVTLAAQLQSIQHIVDKIRVDEKNAQASDYVHLIQNLSASMESLIKLDPFRSIDVTALSETGWLTQVDLYMQYTANLFADVRTEAYHSAVYDFSLILNQALGDKSKVLTNGLIKYGTFIASVASAKNSEEVEGAIESIALPPGSAIIKRSTPFNISINSYLGMHYGNEYLTGHTVGQTGWSTIYGISAPIGFAISTDLRNRSGRTIFGSISGFISLFDIAAVASFRVKDDDTEELPEIKLENIFAPGAYAVWGIGKTPISIGYGWQKGPQLRSVHVPDPNNAGQFKNELLNGYRWSVFVAVDIPLVNLYTRSR